MMFLYETLGNVDIAIRVLCAYICQFLYSAIAGIFNVFMKIATYSFVDVDVKNIYTRVTVILELIMVFYVSFEFVKYIVQPETISDKEKGVSKIGLRIVVVVLAIAFVPSIFDYAYKLQGAIINNGVISKIILGKNISEDEDTTPGGTFSTLMLDTFYHYDEDLHGDQECEKNIKCATIYKSNMVNLASSGKLYSLPTGLKAATYDSNNTLVPLIEFDAIFAVIAGGIIAYMLILYSIDVGARIFQMIFLQIIAPIPIIGYLSPKKDNMFSKWAKQCFTTYLDIFIRLALMYFIMLMTQALSSKLTPMVNDTWGNKILFIALVLGLLMFAQRVPKILGELFPKSSTAASGNFGLKPGDRNLGRAIGAALGLASGAAIGAASGFGQGLRAAKSVEGKGRKAWAGLKGATAGTIKGTLGGAGRGFLSGASKSSNEGFGKLGKNISTGVGKQLKSNKSFGNRAEAGYTLGHQIQDKVGGAFGASRLEQHEKAKVPLERLTKTGEKAQSTLKAMTDDEKLTKAMNGKFKGNAVMDRRVQKLNDTRQRLKDLQTPDSEASKEYRVGARRQDAAGIEQAHRRIRDDKLSKVNADTATYVNGLDETTLCSKYGINRLTYTSQADFDKALAAAKNKEAQEYSTKKIEDINKEYQDNVARDCVYKTEEEARTAMTAEIGKLQKEQHDQEDDVKRAYAYYATYLGQDDEDVRKLHMLQEEVRLYNERTQNPALRINMEEDINEAMYNKAVELLDAYKGNDARTNHDYDDMTPEQLLQTLQTSSDQALIGSLYDNGLFVDYGEILDDWRKKTVPKKYTEQAQMQILRENEAIERIKSETSGSSDKH